MVYVSGDSKFNWQIVLWAGILAFIIITALKIFVPEDVKEQERKIRESEIVTQPHQTKE